MRPAESVQVRVAVAFALALAGSTAAQSQAQPARPASAMPAGGSVGATLYRALLKASQRLADPRGNVSFVEPVNARQWGHGNFLAKPTQPALLFLHGVPPRYSEEAADEFGSADLSASDGSFRLPDIRRFTRRCFEHSMARTGGAAAGERDALEDGFVALRLLAEQQRLRSGSSVRVSGPGLRIECTAAQVEEMAPPPGDPKHGHHAFAYRVSIENVGQTTCRVLGRHWMIEDSSGEAEVAPRGSPGVVGYTPLLRPGQRFVYGSGTLLECDEGRMWGSLQCEELHPPEGSEEDVDYEAMKHGSGDAFEAEIGPFLLRAT